MARNRKRAKERRSRRPATGQVSRPGVATARAERELRDDEGTGFAPESYEDTPGPIDHATPDAELADAQLSLGRPELARDADEVDDGELAAEAMGAGGGGRARRLTGGGRDEGAGEPGEELAPAGGVQPAPRGGARLITFLQGSWRELQRVQWPDRRQVMQATGVVIGFVIVAGLYLALADTVATKLVNLILQ